MFEILVVDDSEFDRVVVKKVFRALGNWHAEYVSSGEIALSRLKEQKFDLLLTDLHMPLMNGLDLLQRSIELGLQVPTVVMSSNGSEESVIKSLRLGAVSYVIKKNMIHDLPEIVESVMRSARAIHAESALLEHLSQSTFHFKIPNNRELLRGTVSYIQVIAERFGKIPEADRIRLGICLEESLLNAMIHGNLEISSDLRQGDADAYDKLIDLRLQQRPYCDRLMEIVLSFTTDQLIFTIRDEGPGFDVDSVPDPTNFENLSKPSGRGLLLIRLFMDDVQHNTKGNQITLVKNLIRQIEVREKDSETMVTFA